jgi:hypothetical protein
MHLQPINHPIVTGFIGPAWQAAYIVIARNLWKHYGSDVLPTLQQHWAGLVRLAAWFDRHADPADGLLVSGSRGDWMGFNPDSSNRGSAALTPGEATAAFHHVLTRRYMAELAGALHDGNSSFLPAGEAAKWEARFSAGVAAYHARFFNATAGGYSPCVNNIAPGPPPHGKPPASCHGTSAHGSQCSNAMALAIGAPPTAALRASVAKRLADDVVAFGHKTTAGVVGYAWVFSMLDKHGYSAEALAVLTGDAYPSIGFMVAQNMTTLCENLACTFHAANGGSQNHIMLGGFDAWVSAALGGLDSAVNATAAGWQHVIVRVAPAAVTVLGHGAVTHDTRFGRVALTWKWDAAAQKLVMVLAVPLGATAEVHSPTSLASLQLTAVREGTHPLWHRNDGDEESAGDAKGVAAAIVHSTGSGTFRFEAQYQ